MSANILAAPPQPKPTKPPRWLPEILRWKLVSEEMPDADTTVIGFNPAWDDRCWGCYWDGEEWFNVDGVRLNGRTCTGRKDPEYDAPTHWAPWPAGPRVEGGAK